MALMSPHLLQPMISKLEGISALTDEERQAVETLPARVQKLRAHQDIVRDGEMASQCCLILEGWTFRYKFLGEGKRQIFSFHIGGDIPDLQSLHIPLMDHSLATLTQATVAFIPHEVIRDLTTRFPNIAAVLWRDTLVDAAIFRAWMMGMGQRSAYDQLAHLFCELYLKQEAVGLAGEHRCPLPMSQIDLADALGISNVHINRVLKEMRGQGLITLRGNSQSMITGLATVAAASRAAIADVFARHERVFVSFSGGKDSLAILRLCEPYRDRLSLVWVNTGLSGIPMTEFVRSFGERFGFIEVAPERPVAEQWAEHGIPAVVLPLDHIEGVDFRSPRLQPWLSCCGVNRVRPVLAFLEAQEGPCAFLNGQRSQDKGGTPAGLSGALPATVEVSLPIWDWTDADVLAFVAEQGIPMHPHFAVSPSSPECIRCPAVGSRAKMNLLDEHYPEDAAFVRQAGRYALGLAATRAMEINAILADPTPTDRNTV